MNKPLDAGKLSEHETGLERWQREYAASVGGDKPARNRSGIEVRPLYTARDGQGDYAADLGYPGQPPYTRGIYASMHRGRTWTQHWFREGGRSSPRSIARSFLGLLREAQKP